MITVDVERALPAAVRSAIDHIWSGAEWQPRPPGLKGLAIEYDDGRHQSVHLCVGWGAGYLPISIVRFRDGAGRISFFHSRSPPGIVRQTGAWEAHPVADGCLLRLVRSVELECGGSENAGAFHAREQAYAGLLLDRMQLALDRVARDD